MCFNEPIPWLTDPFTRRHHKDDNTSLLQDGRLMAGSCPHLVCGAVIPHDEQLAFALFLLGFLNPKLEVPKQVPRPIHIADWSSPLHLKDNNTATKCHKMAG